MSIDIKKLIAILLCISPLLLSSCASKKNAEDGEQATEDKKEVEDTYLPEGQTLQPGQDNANQSSAYQEGMVASDEFIPDRVFFGFDSSELSGEAVNVLKMQTKLFASPENAKNAIVIEGHCDERGTREYNLALGEKRATEVKKFLSGEGLDPTRIKVISYGKERPAVLGTGPDVWKQNRRAVSSFMGN